MDHQGKLMEHLENYIKHHVNFRNKDLYFVILILKHIFQKEQKLTVI